MKNNKLKKVTIILFIVLITMIGFFGIYGKSGNTMQQNFKDYQYSMELDGKRMVTLKLGEDNSDDVKNIDNYQLTKEILEKRLNDLGASDYKIRLDEESGNIVVELAEDDNTDRFIANLTTVGKFEIDDTQTNEVLLNNDSIKTCQVLSNTTSSGTAIVFSIEFNDAKKLEEISKTYVPAEETEEQQEDEANTQENTENSEKTITMKLDDTEMMSTSFEEPITDGKLNLTVGQVATDTESLNDSLKQARNMASLLNNKSLPLKYESDGDIYVASTVKDTITETVISCVTCVIFVSAIILIVKYKKEGLVATIAFIGFAALLLIFIRVWNVVISTEGIAALITVLILNFILSNKMLENINKEENKKAELKHIVNMEMKDFTLKAIPLFIIAIVFSFIKLTSTSSFGMVMFWGLALIEIYNLIITKNLLKYKKQN